MTEHEKLKEICDKIGYDKLDYSDNWAWHEWMWLHLIVDKDKKSTWLDIQDVREIIFTQEFIYKFSAYYLSTQSNLESDLEEKYLQLLLELDNPVDYLYNLIKTGISL